MEESKVVDLDMIERSPEFKDDNVLVIDGQIIPEIQSDGTVEGVDISHLPNFKVEANKAAVYVRWIHFYNFKVYPNKMFNFCQRGGRHQPFICLHGPNGCGKTTVLDCIQLLFNKMEGYDVQRIKNMLGRAVRSVDGNADGLYGDNDFLITAEIHWEGVGIYQIQLNKNGFVENKSHPLYIRDILSRLCYYARFDQDLTRFQLNRSKWPIFKDLFESVTGFEIEEMQDVFCGSEDPIQARLMEEYVLGFWVKKPNETIHHKNCSAGEKKIVKTFSTLLNKEYNPSIILIDNVAMHVESGRHIHMIEAMKRSFPSSQIFSTTHSYQISRNFGDRSQLYDLRLVTSTPLQQSQNWRLYLADEIVEAQSKLGAIKVSPEEVAALQKESQELKDECLSGAQGTHVSLLMSQVENLLKKVVGLYIKDMVVYYS